MRCSSFLVFLLWVMPVGASEPSGSGVEVVPRAAWGALPPMTSKLDPLPMGTIRHVTVHQTETPFPDTVDEFRRLRGIQAWHQTNRNGPQWGDIAYHFLIGPSGTVYEGRSTQFAAASGTVYLTPEQWEAAGQDATGKTTAPKPPGSSPPGASAGHLTISVIGTFHRELPEEKVRDRLTSLIAERLIRHGLDVDDVFFHREVSCWTDCPGQALYDWFRGEQGKRGARGPGLVEVERKVAALRDSP